MIEIAYPALILAAAALPVLSLAMAVTGIRGGGLAVGGWFDGNPDETTVLPQHFDVDYVRAWRKAE